MEWTLEDTRACYKQGFGIFPFDIFIDYKDTKIPVETIGLMKLDDPDEANRIGEECSPYYGPMFDSDEEAAAYVQKQADLGDTVCRKAIDYLIEQKSPDVKEFQLH